MIFPLDPAEPLIVVTARVFGPSGQSILRLALDTGATSSMVVPKQLQRIGYDLGKALVRTTVFTANGVASGSKISLEEIESLGKTYTNFPVFCTPLPSGTGIDGVLGLDFLRGTRLTIDFRMGILILD
jgi:predicted aspartyl protease